MTVNKWEGLDNLKEMLHFHGLRRSQEACDALESWWLSEYVPLKEKLSKK